MDEGVNAWAFGIPGLVLDDHSDETQVKEEDDSQLNLSFPSTFLCNF